MLSNKGINIFHTMSELKNIKKIQKQEFFSYFRINIIDIGNLLDSHMHYLIF